MLKSKNRNMGKYKDILIFSKNLIVQRISLLRDRYFTRLKEKKRKQKR